ncbi:MAG: peptidase M54, partial [Vicinamibacterales bacterium]
LDVRRGQHASSLLLEWLLEHRPHGAVRTLGLTDVDLFIPVLTFVYGEAQLNGPVAVVSMARLSGGPGSAGERLVTARLAKESVHELGHTFGLLHCSSERCVMKRSVSVAAIDGKATTPCGDCRTLLLERSLGLENDHE